RCSPPRTNGSRSFGARPRRSRSFSGVLSHSHLLKLAQGGAPQRLAGRRWALAQLVEQVVGAVAQVLLELVGVGQFDAAGAVARVIALRRGVGVPARLATRILVIAAAEAVTQIIQVGAAAGLLLCLRRLGARLGGDGGGGGRGARGLVVRRLIGTVIPPHEPANQQGDDQQNPQNWPHRGAPLALSV